MSSESIREKDRPEVGPNPVFQAALAEADEPTVEEEVGVTQVQRAAQPARMHAIACRQALSGRKFGRLPWLAAGGCVDD